MGATINNEYVLAQLESFLGEDLYTKEEPYGLLTVVIHKGRILDTLSFLFKDEQMKFRYLTDLTGIHFPDNTGNELGVIYHLHSLENNVRIRIKCFLSKEDPAISSAIPVFAGANWMERETYDFFGILFEGHPDLRRILNVDEMDYFPMRKEYPLEDGTRTDKDDKYFGR